MKRQRPWCFTEKKEDETAGTNDAHVGEGNVGSTSSSLSTLETTEATTGIVSPLPTLSGDAPIHRKRPSNSNSNSSNNKRRPVLSPQDIQAFQEKGFVRLPKAFDPKDAQEARRLVWDRLRVEKGICEDDPSTWPERVGIPDCYETTTPSATAPWTNIVTDRLRTAIDQLCGTNRWQPFGLGWWVISFPGHDVPPWGPSGHWHVDGAQYRHHVNSQESALLAMLCVSTVRPHSGGTALWVGSHKVVAQLLMEHEPKGLPGGRALSRLVLQRLRAAGEPATAGIEELQAHAGDAVLAHPFLLHARSKNLGRTKDSVRFLCHPNVAWKGPMQFPRRTTSQLRHHAARFYDRYAPVERAIVDAILDDDEDAHHHPTHSSTPSGAANDSANKQMRSTISSTTMPPNQRDPAGADNAI